MALQKQKIPLNLTTGIDTKTDDFTSVGFKNVENYRFNKLNALTKVNGYTQYTTDLKSLATVQPAISNANALYSFKNELLLNTEEQLLSYSETVDKWVSKNYVNVNNTGFASAVKNTGITFVNTSEIDTINYIDRDTVPDYYTNADYSAVVASDVALGGIKIQIYENTGTIKILDSFIPDLSASPYNKLSATNRIARIAGIYNNKLYVPTYLAAASSTIIYVYNLATPNDLPTAITVSFADFKVCTMDESTGVIFMAGDNSTTLRIARVNVTTFAFLTVNHTQAVAQVPRFLDLLSVSGVLRITGEESSTSNVYTLVVSQSALTITAALALWQVADHFTTCNDTNNNTYLIFSSKISYASGSPNGNGTSIKALNDSGTTNILGGTFLVAGCCELVGKALYDAGLIYFNAIQGQVSTKSAFVPVSATNSTLFTCKFKVSTLNSNVDSEIIGQSGYFNTTAWNVTTAGPELYRNLKLFKVSNKLKHANIVLAEFYSSDNAGFVEIQKNKVLEVSHELLTKKTKEVVTPNYLLIPTSVPKTYDGRYLVESGFASSPNFVNAVSFAGIGAGTAFATGSYGLAAVYRWQDNNGIMHYSVPQFVNFTVGIANLLSVEIEVRNLGLTNKDDVYIELYGTAVNGSTYYKIPKTIINNKYVGKTNTEIFALEIGITSNEVLYTTGGVIEDDLAAPSTTATNFKNRVFVASSKQLSYSKILEPGTPLSFSANFTVNSNLNNKDIVAIQEMDNSLVIFGSDSISVLSGEGPNNLGEQNDYNTPQQISSDVGCTDPSSVVSTPEGIMFKSEKGIYLLNRGLYVTYIGAPVEVYNSQEVLDAVLLNDTNEIRLLLSDKILSYDYAAKQWGILTNITASAVDSVIHDNAYHYARSNGRVLKHDSTIFTNNNAFYNGKLETNWISVAGMANTGDLSRSQQGFQRLYTINLLAKYKSAHTLEIKIAYDYDETIIDTANIVANSSGTYQWEIKPSRQKCESFKLYIEDKSQSGTGESLILSGLLLEVGIKGTAQKTVPDSKRTTTS